LTQSSDSPAGPASGKTTLLEELIPRLTAAGLRVSLIKHAHHRFDIDHPGKDSYRLREAGCSEVLLISDQRWVLMHELRGAPEPSLEEQIARFSDCDLVLVEGFKQTPIPKLEVHRPSVGKPLIAGTGVETIVAVATDEPAALAGQTSAADTGTRRPRRDRGFHLASSGVQECLITKTRWRACWRAPG
jgi:molybdopterin-guanine dinucleotide biosynthesis protein B